MALSRPYVEVADRQLLVVNVVRALAVVAGAFLLGSIFQSLFVAMLGSPSQEALRQSPPLYFVANATFFAGFFATVLWVLKLRHDERLIHVRTPRWTDAGWVLGGVAALFVAALAVGAALDAIISVLESVFGVSTTVATNQVIDIGQANPELFLYLIPLQLLFVGPAEELLFRGVVQGLLRRSFGVVPGIVFASLLFGLGHVFALSAGDAWTMVFLTASLGLILGVLYEYTESILVPVLTHALWNATLFLTQYLSAVGVDLPV
jgi:membrane protease YdiL (CAAX protease family)